MPSFIGKTSSNKKIIGLIGSQVFSTPSIIQITKTTNRDAINWDNLITENFIINYLNYLDQYIKLHFMENIVNKRLRYFHTDQIEVTVDTKVDLFSAIAIQTYGTETLTLEQERAVRKIYKTLFI